MGALADALMKKGYNSTDAANAESGPRAAELAREYGVGSGGGSSGGGDQFVGSLDISQVPSVTDYVNKQFASEQIPLDTLTAAMKARETPDVMYNRYSTEAGLPELKQTATSLSKEIANTEDFLDMVEPDVAARTRESLVTEAQRRGMVASQKEPWVDKLTKLSTSLGRVGNLISTTSTDVNNRVTMGLQGQEMQLEPLKLVYQTTVDRNARLLTGFTADRQTLLDSLMDKLNRQRTLSDQEWVQANSLASEERSYTKELKTAAASAGVKLSGSESNDQLLALIGEQAAAKIAFERRNANKGTETERSQATALTQLRNDISRGDTFENLVRRYADILPTYQIQAEYNSGSRYGAAKEDQATINSWTLKPKADSGSEKVRIVRPDGSVIEM